MICKYWVLVEKKHWDQHSIYIYFFLSPKWIHSSLLQELNTCHLLLIYCSSKVRPSSQCEIRVIRREINDLVCVSVCVRVCVCVHAWADAPYRRGPLTDHHRGTCQEDRLAVEWGNAAPHKSVLHDYVLDFTVQISAMAGLEVTPEHHLSSLQVLATLVVFPQPCINVVPQAFLMDQADVLPSSTQTQPSQINTIYGSRINLSKKLPSLADNQNADSAIHSTQWEKMASHGSALQGQGQHCWEKLNLPLLWEQRCNYDSQDALGVIFIS